MIGFLSKINRKKSTAIFVINCFLFSFVYGNVIAEVSANIQAGKQYAQIFNNFILPYSYGKITETHITDSSRVVIQIQDLHCHPQVQKNISNIIELVDNKLNGGINAVYLEGAYGDVDTSWLKQLQNTNDELRINNKEVRQSGAVSQEFLDKIIQTGRLTGAEYYSALTGKYDIIKGLESKEEYIDNLKRFGGILENQDEILLIIKGIEDSAKELKKRYYNRKQIKVENLFESYAKQEISSRKYYALLSKHMDGLGLDINKYENTSLYMGLMKKEKELKYDEISKDLQRFVFILKEKLPYAAYKMILESTNNFTQTDKLYGYLISLSREFNIDLTINFPELNKFFAYVETSQKINPLELVNEEQRLRSDINSRFSDTKAQREVVFLTNFDKYIKDYLMSKITSRDYDYYKENIETYRKLWVKYVDNRVLSLLDEHIKESDIFYDINVYRNEYFARELGVKGKTSVTSSEANRSDVSPFSLNELINNLDNKQVDIAITGGFHTEGVSEILRNNNISYIVITPNVSDGVKEAEEVYYKIAKLQSKQLTNNNLQLTKQSIQVIPESSSRESQTSFSSSALANMILSLDAPSRTAFINALQTGGDLTKIDVETPQAKKIQEIIKVVQGAKLLESDDNEEIIGRIKEIIEESLSENSLYKGKITQELIENLDLKKVKEGLDGNISRLESILKIAEIRQNSNSELEAQLKKTVELLKEFSSDIYKHSKSLFPNEILSDSNVFNMLDGILTDMPFLDKSIEESANDSKLQEMFTNIQKNTAGKEGFSNLRQYYEEEITFVLLDDLSESTIFISKSDYKKTDYSTTDSLINGSVFLYKGKKYIFASKKYFSKLNNSQKRQFIGDVFENFQNIASRTEIFTELASGQLIETILEIYSNLLSEKDGALFLSGFFKEKIDYKKRLSLTEKIIADNLHIIPQGKLIPLFGKDGIEYLKIIQNRNSQKNLHSTISNKKMSLKNRTFALMYLKLNGIGGSDYDAFSSDAVKNIGTLANNIKTDFDLRIALTAIWELFMSNPNINKAQYLPKESYKNMYENISEAARLTNKSEHMNARSDLMFDIVDFSALLHEMGHNVLMVLFPNLNVNDVSIATLHEIFAYSSAEVHDKDENSKNFESKYGDYKEKADKAGKKINKAGIYEEEHLDAKVFLNRINDFHKSLNTPIDWNLLQTSIIKYIETLEKTKKDVKLDDLFEIYKFDSESDIDSNNIRNINRLDNILKTNEIHQTSSNPITILKETLNKYKNKFLGVRSMASDYDYQKALAGFNNGTNVIPDINGDLDDPASISDILWGLDFAVQNNFNSNEFVVQAIRPAGYEDISYLKQYSKGPLNAFWLGAIVNKLRADGKSEKDIEREILGLVEKTKIEIEMRKTEIIEKMKNSKVEYMSGHLWTYSPFGNEKWPKVNQEGKLDENDAITKMFLIQLEIAASLGIKRVVSHLNSMDVEGYAAFVEHAAGLGITVNFENEILYDAESGYDYNQVLADRGFANHKDFMDSIERIHAKLSDNGKAHFGLLLDMGKALQSFTKSISVDENGEISQEVFEEEAAKLNLDNLKEYYKYVIDRGQEIGVKINEIHLSQMSALSEDLRNEQGKLEKKKVFYKKTKIDQQNNPNLDILKFLEFIQSPGEAKYKFDGLLIQETDGIVPALDLQKTTSKLKTGFVKNAIRSISMLAMTLMLTLAMTASSFLPGFSGKQNNQVESQITVSQEQNIKSDSVLYKDNTKLVEIFSNPENPFAPLDNSGNTSFDAIQQSIDFSNTPETQARVNTAIRNIINSESLKATGFVFDKIPEVFFPRNSAAANVYPATILYEENLIVIPAEHLSYETLRISLETLIAHEYQHKIDAAKVESGKMSMIESEARAMLAGALVIPMAGDFIIIDGQKIDAHEGQKAESFKILHDNDNKKQIKNYFPDADFNNIYYTGEIHRAISQEEYDKLPLKEKKQFNLSLEENELGITLYDTKGDNTKTIYCAVNYQTKEMRIISRSAAQSTINQDGDSGVILKMRGGIPVVLTSFSALISNPLFLITLGVFAAVAVSYFITIKSLNSILDLLDNWELIDKNSKRTQKIVSVIKTPLMLLSFASPSFAKRYNGDSEKRAEIFNRIKKSLLDTINMTEEEFLNVSFVKRISKLLNLNVIKIQYKKHAAFNSASTVSAEDISFISEEIYVNSRFNDIVNLLGKEKITGIAGAVLNSFRNDNWYWDTDPPVHTMYDNLVRVERILQEIYDNTRDGIIDVDKLLADNFKSYRHDSANNLLDNIFTTLFGFETQVFEFEEAMSLHINMSDEDNLSGIKISKNNFVVFNRPAEIPKADYFHGTGKEKEKTAEQKVAGIIKSRVLFKSKEMSVMHAQSHLGVSFANNVNLAKRYSRLDGAVFGFSGDVNAQRTHEAYNYNNGSVIYTLYNGNYHFSEHGSGKLSEIIFFSKEKIDSFLETLTKEGINLPKGVALRLVTDKEDTYYYEADEKDETNIKENVSFEETEAMTRLSKLLDFL
ncbi:MAG: hypothetical protein FWF32_04205, partial [Endomicrobia bacterium]|nr:hypothetical protein [Endomicrobiia bacterium]